MTNILLTFIFFLSSFSVFSQDIPNPSTSKEDSNQSIDYKEISYLIGVMSADNALNFLNLNEKDKSIPLEKHLIIKGYVDAIVSEKKLSREDFSARAKYLDNVFNLIKAESLIYEKEKSVEFLNENSKNKNVITLKSGLQYEVVKKGSGTNSFLTDTVTVNYKGSLINGKVFDSNEGEEPVSFEVSSVIKGWTEILQLMNVGSKFKVYVPSDLAYGDQGKIGINGGSVLLFEIEILDIKR
jgi:FKBP-type peptidyl-prolyl cis-trans isomerase FkpA